MAGGLGTYRHQCFLEAQGRRAQWIELAAADPDRSPVDICAEMGMSMSTYRQWRHKYKDFAARVDVARGTSPAYNDGGWGPGGIAKRNKGGSAAADRARIAGDFGPFRKTYFDHDSPWFHLLVVDALERAEDGSVTLILLPPSTARPPSSRTSSAGSWPSTRASASPWCPSASSTAAR